MKCGEYILVIAPNNYPGKLYRNRYCYEHHLVYWQNTGHAISNGEIIHHKDGNKRNNAFDNLILLNKYQHDKLHASLIKTSYVRLKCPGCGSIFVRRKNNTHLSKRTQSVSCCSRHCIGLFTNLPFDKKMKALRG